MARTGETHTLKHKHARCDQSDVKVVQFTTGQALSHLASECHSSGHGNWAQWCS